ncbi:dinitrogenase iron-molybdenum cofactor biosynthesis protein [Acetobacterium paludosum]|uniref:Dinitrogenase iron-molybdenum cofactor biosynthesis protein n=1 Tax=Acetobacterium paludosum TaxID=52693 RepID=A0A923KND5_9FIRM|nr:NifB/NifX family molybdenum-iron cluster-binding protein [Acetobacterium paludosum]MBC3887014.1 dinitrogenase iron-molybdenum cofactor biosynthesis protein [Acetobacterium paludosum]
MKIAIPADENTLQSEVCMSFGRAPYFYIFDTATQTGEFIINGAAMEPGGAGIKAAQIIVDNQAEALITPRCGENAADVFKVAKVKIYKSSVGTIQDNINSYNDGKLDLLDHFHAGFHGRGEN